MLANTLSQAGRAEFIVIPLMAKPFHSWDRCVFLGVPFSKFCLPCRTFLNRTIFIFLLRRAFDVEVLYIAQQLHIPVSEVAVNWKEIEGVCVLLLSHCSILGDILTFFFRVKAGPILELATDGQGHPLYQTPLHVWDLDSEASQTEAPVDYPVSRIAILY